MVRCGSYDQPMEMDGPVEQDGLSPNIRSYWRISMVENVTEGVRRWEVNWGMRTDFDRQVCVGFVDDAMELWTEEAWAVEIAVVSVLV